MCRVKEEVKTACFGDARLNVRMEKILRNLGDRPTCSLQQALNWLLLTYLPIDTFEQASLILQWYAKRWEIEIFFRVLKQGLSG